MSSSLSSANSHVPIEQIIPGTPVRRCPRRFPSQARALLIRTWHVQRRQHCRLFFSFVLAPILVVVFAVIARNLDTRQIEALPDEQEPSAAFAARPLDAAQCPRLRLIGQEDECLNDPFVPKPFQIPFAVASGVDSQAIGDVTNRGCDAKGAALLGCLTSGSFEAPTKNGLLGNLSLSPFIFPDVVSDVVNRRNTKPRDLVFLNAVLGRNRFAGADLDSDFFQPDEVERAYDAFRIVEDTPGGTDAAYRTQTRQFTSRSEMLDNIFNVWREGTVFSTYYSAYFFKEYKEDSDSLTMDVTAFYNESSSFNCTRECDLTSSIIRLSNAAYQRLEQGRSANVYLRRFPNIDTTEDLGLLQLILSVFIGLLYHFLFPGFLRFLVYERSSKLRDMMQMMGLKPVNYWIVTYLGLLAEYGVFAILLMIEGFAAGVQFYTQNSVVAYMVLFFLWGNVMIALAMLLSPFFENPEPALIFGWFYTIITSFIGGPFLGRLLASDEPESTWYAVQLLPSFAFLRSVYYMGAFNAGGKGVTLGDEFFGGTNLNMCGPGPLCRSYVFLIIEWIILVVLGLYFDRVLPGATGIRSHPLFFLGFQRHGARGCFGKKRESVAIGEHDTKTQYGEGEDVVAEQILVRELVERGAPSGIVIDSLHKLFPTQPPVHAVNGLSLIAKRNEVFGILGGNGAGKTTAFKIITGELEPTSGDVYVNGHSVRSESLSIQEDLGLCPQHDRQWGELTGEEHLYFYARVKLIAPKDLKASVDAALESVQLTFARKRKASEYSGGMRRRLSVAISFMGEPSLIVLDEPTTGLDPKSIRKVWECIQSHKEGKTILLTTHSLEEAETLCDRVGIMAYGRLKCIGRPDELKLRLGRGYRLTFSLPESNIKDLHALLTGLSEEATFETALAGNVVYTLPNQVALSTLFKAIQDNKQRLRIRDWGVTQSSLEDVFIDITKQQQQYMEKTLQTAEV